MCRRCRVRSTEPLRKLAGADIVRSGNGMPYVRQSSCRERNIGAGQLIWLRETEITDLQTQQQ